MQDDLISVIVPVDNAEEYLDRCVESLVNQSYENIEIILVDDASTDDSSIMCDSWTQKDIRIKVIHNKTKSTASCKNAGLDYANGEYVTFVNANHFVDKEYIFTLLKNLEETHSDISICSLCRYLENENKVEEEKEPEEHNENSGIVLNTVEDDGEDEEELEKIDEDETEQESDAIEENEEINNETDDNDETGDDTDANGMEVDDTFEGEEFANEDDDENKFDVSTQNVKILEKKKNRSRIVIFEGDDIFDYFFSGVEKIKTAPYGKLYRKNIFKKLRFDEDRIYEDEFIADKIYSTCKKFVRTSSGLYYYSVNKKPLKNAQKFTLKDLDFYYALENRYNNFKDTKWQPQALNQLLVQIANIYCLARAGKAESNTLKFLKHKFKLYYNLQKKHKTLKCFKNFPNLYYYLKCYTTRNK